MKKILTTVALAAAAFASTSAFSADLPPVLVAGSKLNPGDSMISHNKVYQLTMQGDGNLVIYRRSYLERTYSGALITHNYVRHYRPVWSTSTGVNNSYATMQTDGNFIVSYYMPLFGARWITAWGANAGGKTPDAYRLVLGETGMLTIEDGKGSQIQFIRGSDPSSMDAASEYLYAMCSNGVYNRALYASGGFSAFNNGMQLGLYACPNGFPAGLIPGR